MNRDQQALYDFAEQVRQKAHFIMSLGVGGDTRAKEAGAVAAQIVSMAAQAKTAAQMQETLEDPERYDLATLPASSPFDE